MLQHIAALLISNSILLIYIVRIW